MHCSHFCIALDTLEVAVYLKFILQASSMARVKMKGRLLTGKKNKIANRLGDSLHALEQAQGGKIAVSFPNRL